MRLLWLPEVLRAAEVPVVEQRGWQTRGKDLTRIDAVIWHHTVTGPGVPDERVASLLRDGRSDLAGPLAQIGLRRDGTWDVIASGKANHNGFGTFGNQTIGIEAYNDGVSEPWPTAQVESWITGTAAICTHLALPVARVLGHKESDPDRKIDPHTLDMPAMRSRITAAANDDQGDDDVPLSDDDLAKIDALILKRLQPLNDRVTDLHAEVVEPRDGEGKSRMDRIAELVTTLRPKKP